MGGTIDKFKDVIDNRHTYAKDWKKRTGGKVVGWLCTYAPEEIIYAAGILPVRCLGSHEPQDVTDAYIFSMYCPFCRDVLAQGLKGRYNYLDGIVKARSCVHIRNTFLNWKKHIPIDFAYYVYMPAHIQSPRAKPLLIKEYADFKLALEKWTGKKITDSDLDGAIDVYNTNRRLLKQVYEMRKQEKPPITGTEAMTLVVSSQLMDKAEHNKLLEEFIKELPGRNQDREVGVRLMLIGSEDDDIEFIRKTEELGVTIVIDENCSGTRYFWQEIVPEHDRLAALATRYINRAPCPTKDWPERKRLPLIMKMARDYNVQGALLYQQKFCDPHEFDIPVLQQMFKKENIPTLFLEFDVTVPFGQFRTRIEAFLEMMQLEVL